MIDTDNKQRPTGIRDKMNHEMFCGDTVNLLGITGTVDVMNGAYGIKADGDIDWKTIEDAAKRISGEKPKFLKNNCNFISFYELMYNFDCIDDYIDVIERAKTL